MTQDKLASLRFVVPGTLILILVYTLITPRMNWTEASSVAETAAKALVLPALLGALYRIFGVRRKLLTQILTPVTVNIDNRILFLCSHRSFSPDLVTKLRSREAFSNVFYKVIDSDPTLTLRAGRVRDNGMLLSSGVDLFIVGTAGWIAHLVLLITTGNAAYLKWWYVWAGASALSVLVFLPVIVRTHIKLSNGQLDFIAAHNAQAVRTGVDSEIASLSA